MSERDEFEARVDDLVARSFVVTDGPRHPFSKGGETWAERDAVVRVVLADVAARAPQAVPALTDEQIERLRASLFSQVESEAIAMLTASPAALTHEQFMGFRDAVDDLECELQTRYQGYPEDDRRRVRDFAVVKRARALLRDAAPQPSPVPRRYQD